MKKNYYAIKIGNNVKNLIVDTWDKCKEYVIGYPSVYKSFETYRQAKKYLENMTDEQVTYILLENEIHRFRRLKEKIEFEYGFHIPDYVIDEIINNNDYENLCLLINMAVISKRLSVKQGNIIKKKKKLKKINYQDV